METSAAKRSPHGVAESSSTLQPSAQMVLVPLPVASKKAKGRHQSLLHQNNNDSDNKAESDKESAKRVGEPPMGVAVKSDARGKGHRHTLQHQDSFNADKLEPLFQKDGANLHRAGPRPSVLGGGLKEGGPHGIERKQSSGGGKQGKVRSSDGEDVSGASVVKAMLLGKQKADEQLNGLRSEVREMKKSMQELSRERNAMRQRITLLESRYQAEQNDLMIIRKESEDKQRTIKVQKETIKTISQRLQLVTKALKTLQSFGWDSEEGRGTSYDALQSLLAEREEMLAKIDELAAESRHRNDLENYEEDGDELPSTMAPPPPISSAVVPQLAGAGQATGPGPALGTRSDGQDSTHMHTRESNASGFASLLSLHAGTGGLETSRRGRDGADASLHSDSGAVGTGDDGKSHQAASSHTSSNTSSSLNIPQTHNVRIAGLRGGIGGGGGKGHHDGTTTDLHRRLNSLLRVMSEPKSSAHVDVIIERIKVHMPAILDCQYANVLMVDPVSRHMYHQGPEQHQPLHTLPLSRGISGCAATTRRALRVRHVKDDPRFDPKCDELADVPTSSILSYPVLDTTGNVIAIAQAVNSRRPEGFLESEETLMAIFAMELASVILCGHAAEEIQLNRESQLKLFELPRQLYAAAVGIVEQTISSAAAASSPAPPSLSLFPHLLRDKDNSKDKEKGPKVDLHAVLKEAEYILRTYLKPVDTRIYLVDAEESVIWYSSEDLDGSGVKVDKKRKFKMGLGFCGYVCQTREPIHITNPALDDRFHDLIDLNHTGSQGELIVSPCLDLKGTLAGVIEILLKHPSEPYEVPRTLEYLKRFGQQFGPTMERFTAIERYLAKSYEHNKDAIDRNVASLVAAEREQMMAEERKRWDALKAMESLQAGLPTSGEGTVVESPGGLPFSPQSVTSAYSNVSHMRMSTDHTGKNIIVVRKGPGEDATYFPQPPMTPPPPPPLDQAAAVKIQARVRGHQVRMRQKDGFRPATVPVPVMVAPFPRGFPSGGLTMAQPGMIGVQPPPPSTPPPLTPGRVSLVGQFPGQRAVTVGPGVILPPSGMIVTPRAPPFHSEGPGFGMPILLSEYSFAQNTTPGLPLGSGMAVGTPLSGRPSGTTAPESAKSPDTSETRTAPASASPSFDSAPPTTSEAYSSVQPPAPASITTLEDPPHPSQDNGHLGATSPSPSDPTEPQNSKAPGLQTLSPDMVDSSSLGGPDTPLSMNFQAKADFDLSNKKPLPLLQSDRLGDTTQNVQANHEPALSYFSEPKIATNQIEDLQSKSLSQPRGFYTHASVEAESTPTSLDEADESTSIEAAPNLYPLEGSAEEEHADIDKSGGSTAEHVSGLRQTGHNMTESPWDDGALVSTTYYPDQQHDVNQQAATPWEDLTADRPLSATYTIDATQNSDVSLAYAPLGENSGTFEESRDTTEAIAPPSPRKRSGAAATAMVL